MSYIIKEKNYLIFELPENKKYYFNINTASFCSVRDKNKPIKTAPKGYRKIIYNNHRANPQNAVSGYMWYLLEYLGLTPKDWSAEELTLVDKIEALGYTANKWLTNDFRVVHYHAEKLNENFKTFSKLLLSNPDEDLETIYDRYIRLKYMEETGLKNDNEIPEEVKNAFCNANISKEKIPLAKMMYKAGYWELIGRYEFANKLETYYEFCKDLDTEPRIEKDFAKNFSMVYKAHKAQQEIINAKRIKEYMLAKEFALNFENEDFIIKIPTTPQEFAVEGNAMRNCVGSWGLNQVKQKDSRIVFVRKRTDPDTSYVDCQIYNNGSIGQFYEKGNHTPTEENIKKFKQEFQLHLNEVWDKEN